MGKIADAFRSAWRDYVTDGVPSSGKNDPKKSDVRSIGSLIEDEISAAAQGYVVQPTWTGLAATPGTRNGQPGRVPTTDTGTHSDPVVGGTVANSGEFVWSVSPAGWRRVGDVIDPPAIKSALLPPLQAFDALSAAQIIGSPAIPSSGTALGGSTYVFNKPVQQNGYVTRLTGFALSAGVVRVKKFLLIGGTFTQVGSDVAVDVPAGAFEISLKNIGYVSIEAGQYLGFWASAPAIIPVNAGALPTDSRTPYYASSTVTNVSAFAASTLVTASRIELRLQVETIAVSADRVGTVERSGLYALAGLRSALVDAEIYSPALAFLEHHGAWYDFGDRSSMFKDANRSEKVVNDGDLVGYVLDKSGNGYDFAVTDTSYRPSYKRKGLGRRSVVSFGSTHHMKAVKTGLTRKRDKVTVFALARWPAPSGGQAIIVHSILENQSGSRLYVGQVGIPSASRIGALVRPSDTGASINVLSYKYLNLNYVAGEWVILECEMDWRNGEANFFTNGYSSVEGTVTFTPAATSRDEAEAAIWLGGMGPSTNPFIGDLAEVVELCGDLAPETREGIYAYLSRKALDLQLGDLEEYDPNGPLPVVFFWFNDPNVLAYDADKYFVGGVSSGGSIMVGDYDYSGAELTIKHKVLFPLFLVDDHAVPAFAQLADGNVVAVFCRHAVDPTMWVSKTTTPGDLSTFSTPVDVGASINPVPAHNQDYSYNLLFRLAGEANRLYLVFRSSDNDDMSAGWRAEDWCLTWSDDEGSTWAQAKKLWGTQRPYSKAWSNGIDRIDFLFNNTHPGGGFGASTHNSVYHCYYQGGSFYQTDGTLVGAMADLPLDFTEVTTVYDQIVEGLGRSWVWDVRHDPLTGYPVGCFATFLGAGFVDHRYRQARWNGVEWVHHEVCVAGGPLIPHQLAYSGGVITDPENINVVYCSRQVDAEGDLDAVNGVYQLFRYVTADGGLTWTGTQLTFGENPSFRPVIPAGSRKLFYVTGPYGPDYKHFHTKVAVLDIE